MRPRGSGSGSGSNPGSGPGSPADVGEALPLNSYPRPAYTSTTLAAGLGEMDVVASHAHMLHPLALSSSSDVHPQPAPFSLAFRHSHAEKNTPDESPIPSPPPPSFAESERERQVLAGRRRTGTRHPRIPSPLQASLLQLPDAHVSSHGALPERNLRDTVSPSRIDDAADSDPKVELKSGRSKDSISAPDGWPFAPWGSTTFLELSPAAWEGADNLRSVRPQRHLGPLRAAAVAGNAVIGSIFYTLPSLIAASGIWSPISLLVACFLIAPFRWVMVELCDSFGAADSANYAFFAHTASMLVATVAAAATALDALATGAVSASTAAAYLSPLTPGMSHVLWAIVLLAAISAVSCLGLGDSSRVALAMLTLHIVTMVVLMVSAAVWWGQNGSDVLRANWSARHTLLASSKSIPRSLFDGVCAAFVGLTGFECAPSYAGHVKQGAFSKSLWWLQIAVLLLEPGLMLFCLAGLSTTQLTDAAQGGSANLLALLGARVVGGNWLRLLVTIDAAVVLCGGIITGIISFCGLFFALGSDRIVPSWSMVFIPRTKAPIVSIAAFLIAALILEATTNFSLASLSQVFSLSFLVILALFSIALLMARFRRPALFQVRRPDSSISRSNSTQPDPNTSLIQHPSNNSDRHLNTHHPIVPPNLQHSPSSPQCSAQSTTSAGAPSKKSPRDSSSQQQRTALTMIGVAFGIAATAIGGNVALNPHSLLLYALYALVLFVLLHLARTRVVMARLLLWIASEVSVDSQEWLPARWRNGFRVRDTRSHVSGVAAPDLESRQVQHRPHAQQQDRSASASLGLSPIYPLPSTSQHSFPVSRIAHWLRFWIHRERQYPLIYFAADDELRELIAVLGYMASNECASHVYVVHCFLSVEQVPSELEAHCQIVDESFPTITVDLVLVEADWSPRTAWAIAGQLGVPLSRCLIGSPQAAGAAPGRGWDMSDLAPLRIIHA